MFACSNGSVSVVSTSTFKAPAYSSKIKDGVTVDPRTTALKIEGQCDSKTKYIQYSLDSGVTWKDLVSNKGDDLDCSDRTFSFYISDLYKGYLGTVDFSSTENKTFMLRSMADGEFSDASSDLTIQYSPNWCTTFGNQSTACSADQGTFWASSMTFGTNITGNDGEPTITIPAGYYDGTQTSTITDTNLTAANIRSGVLVLGVTGSAPEPFASCTDDSLNSGQCSTAANRYVYTSNFGGRSSDCTSGLNSSACWTNTTNQYVTGSLGTTVSGTNGSLSTTIPVGYYNGSTSASMSDTNLAAANIKSGVSIFGITGTAPIPFASCTDNILNNSQCSTATNRYVYTSIYGGVTPAYADCSEDTGTINNSRCSTSTARYVSATLGSDVTIWTNLLATSEVDASINNGYYNGKSCKLTDNDLTAGNIKSGVDIFGVTGTLTPAYAACSEDSGTLNNSQCSTSANRYVASVAGSDITSWSGSGTTSITASIPDGYYNTKSITFTDADLVASKILNGIDIFGVTGSVVAAYSACSNNALNASQCSTATNSYVSTTLGGDITISGSTSSSITQGYYDGTKSCTISDANLIAANIKLSKTILGIAGTFDGIALTSNAYRNKATTPISQIAESSTYAGGDLPAGYRMVPTIATDDDGYLSANSSSPQVTLVLRNIVTGDEWNTGVPRIVCGKGINTSIANKIIDCSTQHSAKPSWDAGVAGKISWDGNINGNAGQGIWTLVSVYSSSLANGDLCDTTCKEVWRDDRTGLIWSDKLPIDNWCRASGNAEAADPSNLCNNITYQPNYPTAAESWCAEDGPTTMMEATGSGETWASSSYHDAKGGLGKTTAISVRWRLPTKYDYGAAENNGIRFVLPGMSDNNSAVFMEWTSTIKASDRSSAIAFDVHHGTSATGVRSNNTDAVTRCIGR